MDSQPPQQLILYVMMWLPLFLGVMKVLCWCEVGVGIDSGFLQGVMSSGRMGSVGS